MKKLLLLLLLVTGIIYSSCKKDDPAPTNNNTTTTTTTTPKKPVADFGFTTGNCEGPCSITFLNASQNAKTYKWDFGDTTTSTEFKPVHVYKYEGSYKVTLTATGDGGTHSVQKTVNVTFAQSNIDPVTPDFTFVEGNCYGPCTVNFTNTSKNSTSYVWEFGDGGTSTDVNPTHEYTTEGTYTVKLTATGAKGTKSITKPVTITFKVTSASILISKIWKFEDVLVNGTREPDFYQAFSGERYIFRSGGAYEEYNISDPVTTKETGTWSLSPDEKILKVIITDGSSSLTKEMDVLEITQTKLRFGKSAGNEIIYVPE